MRKYHRRKHTVEIRKSIILDHHALCSVDKEKFEFQKYPNLLKFGLESESYFPALVAGVNNHAIYFLKNIFGQVLSHLVLIFSVLFLLFELW